MKCNTSELPVEAFGEGLPSQVATFPDKKNSAAKPPVPAHYVVESSPGNRQHYVILEKPLPAAEAGPLLESWHQAVGGDSAAKNLCGLWRCPGTLNYPNAAKLKRGRVVAPSGIAQLRNGERITADTLRGMLPARARVDSQQPVPIVNSVARYEFEDVCTTTWAWTKAEKSGLARMTAPSP